MFNYIHIFLIFFLISSPAYSYLDPGSGSIILQAILGFIAAAIAIVSFYWNKFKMFILKIFKKEKKSEKG